MYATAAQKDEASPDMHAITLAQSAKSVLMSGQGQHSMSGRHSGPQANRRVHSFTTELMNDRQDDSGVSQNLRYS